MATDIDRSTGTLTEESTSSTDTSELLAGLDRIDESVAELQSLEGHSGSQRASGNQAVDLLYRFQPNGIIRLTQAARNAYQDVRVSVERLLDSEGFLRALSPLQQRRKVWEAWKHSHGFGFQERSPALSHGLERDAVSLIERAEHIPKSRPSSHRDIRGEEAVDLVDELFETDCCLTRARLLHRIAQTFDGLLTTSLRQQLVDVLGSHLIGLDDQPAVGYTGRDLTIQEQVAAATAIRRTSSPHAFYYLEKFVEDSGRSYQYNVSGEVKHHRTTAVVRAAVVRAVEGMLDDVERSSLYSNRTDTWKMREYATDVGNLRRRLAELNRHLYADPSTPWTLERPLPLPPDAGRYSAPAQRLWRELTTFPEEQLTALSQVLAGFDRQQTNSPPENASYVTRTRSILDRLIGIPADRWTDLQQQLTSAADLHPCAVAISRFCEERSRLLKSSESSHSPMAGERRENSFWGDAQEEELTNLTSHAEFLLANHQEPPLPSIRSQAHAIDAIAAVLARRRAVIHPSDVYLTDLSGGRQSQANRPTAAAVAQLRRRVEQAGGPAMYYQVACRPENDPNRVLFEVALALLAVVAQGSSRTIESLAKTRARQHLAEYGAQEIVSLLETWCDSSATRRVRLQDGRKIHEMLLEFGPPDRDRTGRQ